MHIVTTRIIFLHNHVQQVVHTHVQGAIIDSKRSTASSLSATDAASQVIHDAGQFRYHKLSPNGYCKNSFYIHTSSPKKLQ